MNKSLVGVILGGVVILILAGIIIFIPAGNEIVPPAAPNPQSAPAAAFTSEKVIVDNVSPDSIVTSGMEITGRARLYYFEASFPVTLLDANGKVVLQTYAQAQGEWMTEQFVPFKVENFVFTMPSTVTGKLILAKDNPSGLPEHDEQVEIPIRFQ